MGATVGIIGAVGQIGSSILGGISGGKAAAHAGDVAAAEMEKARQFQEGVYSTAQTNLNPWITGGQEALGGIEQFLGLPTSGGATAAPGGSGALASYNQFTKTPFYTFPLAQTTDTMERAARAKGMSLGSGQLADLGKYGANYAATNFGSYLTALQGLSGMGMTGATNLGNIGVNVGSQVGQSSAGIGNALAGGIMGQNLAQQNMFQGIGQGLNSLANTVSPLFGPGGGTGSSYGPQNPMIGGTSVPGAPGAPNNFWYGNSATPGMGGYG